MLGIENESPLFDMDWHRIVLGTLYCKVVKSLYTHISIQMNHIKCEEERCLQML
jgi:hypothetical protein